MIKILFLLFLAWLAFKMLKAGRVVVGIMRGVEEAIQQAQAGAASGTPQHPPRRPEDPPITVHRRADSGRDQRVKDAEDARFHDL